MNTFPILLGTLCVFALAYRYYSAFIAAKVLVLDDRRTTPAHVYEDGHNYVPSPKWVLFEPFRRHCRRRSAGWTDVGSAVRLRAWILVVASGCGSGRLRPGVHGADCLGPAQGPCTPRCRHRRPN